VKALLMGGQACIFYGAAEFSKDADIVLLAAPDNVARLRNAVAALNGTQRYVPSLQLGALNRGHAVHFDCGITKPKGVRLDVMSKLRGVDTFELLWERRTTFTDHDGNIYDVLGLEDLVRAKKTRRPRDWPIVARLVEANYIENSHAPTDRHVQFWLREMRTPKYLIEIARSYPAEAREFADDRPLLRSALAADEASLEEQLSDEERAERKRDNDYWLPLLRELEQQRRSAGR
jgi:hypothetical protein